MNKRVPIAIGVTAGNNITSRFVLRVDAHGERLKQLSLIAEE